MSTPEAMPELLTSIHDARLCCERILAQLETIRETLSEKAHEEKLQNLRTVHENICDAIGELQSPSLQIAFVGTTNAGKSTTVNGFIGRRLAPMENDEMSAGLLTFVHTPQWSLQIERGTLAGQGANTETEIYDVLKLTMESIIRDRRARVDAGDTTPTPQPIFRVSCPLLPAHETQIFFKSTGGKLGLTVHDLPGLRTTDDSENLQVIQAQIKRSLCVVIIDRNSLFEREKRDTLLSELEEVVAALGGSSVLTLFLLNKIDTRTAEDRPITDQQKEAAESIRKKLDLPQLPTIIPFSGLLLYRGNQLLQALLEKRFADAQAMRRVLRHDCWGYLDLYLNATRTQEQRREARRKIRQIEDDIDDGVDSSPTDLVHLGSWLIEAAGGPRLLENLHQRLAQHGSQILIFPVIYERQRKLRALIREMRGYAETQLIDNQTSLDAAIEQLNKAELLVNDKINNHRQELKDKIAGLMKLSQDAKGFQTNLSARHDLLKELGIKEDKHKELFAIEDLMVDLGKDLDKSILSPLIHSLKYGESSRDLEFKLEKVGHRSNILKVCTAYEEMRSGDYLSCAEKGYTSTNQGEFYRLERLGNALQSLFDATRALLTYRAGRFLLFRGGKISKHVEDVAHNLAEKIWNDVYVSLNKELGSTLLSLPKLSRSDIPQAEHSSLPEDIIKIEKPNIHSTDTGTRTVERLVQRRWWWWDKYETVTETTYTRRITIPSAGQLHDELSQAIQRGRDQFWGHFFGWFEQQFQLAMDSLANEFAVFTHALRRGLEDRKTELRQDTAQKREQWQKLLAEVDALDSLSNQLAEMSGLQNELPA